jgi:queuine/archaeosine tRNA-ribosyltransferase
VREPTAWRLLSIHNLRFTLDLMDAAGRAIRVGRLDDLRREVAACWVP